MSDNVRLTSRETRQSNGPVNLFILVTAAVIAFLVMVIPEIQSNRNQTITIGGVSSQEVLAPYSINFESKVLTERARREAASNVAAVYLPPDPNIAIAQIEKLTNALVFITSVRNDGLASPQEKMQDLHALEIFTLDDDDYKRILDLEDSEWQSIGQEATRVLETVLRESLRNDQIGTARSNLPSQIEYSFNIDQRRLITTLVSPLIVPTSLYNEAQTELARDNARALIDPITRQIITGEVIVRRGQIVTEEIYEALSNFGLVNPVEQDNMFIKTGLLVAACALIVGIYFAKSKDKTLVQASSALLIAVIFLVFLGLARFLVIDHTIMPYLYPLAAFGLTLAIVFNMEFGILMAVILSILTVFGQGRDAELTIFYLLPSITGILVVGKARRISSFFGSGALVGVVAAAMVVSFRLGDLYTDWLGLGTLAVSALFNGLVSGTLALLLQHTFAIVLDVPTALQLMDVSRPDHPLMQHILRNAPGTYQHSLQVSNLAEQAAEAIGADRLLVRVGTLYHDVGKTVNSSFFIENQVREKIDSHESVSPEVAAVTIINHVTEGVALAKKYRLPSRVIDFIREHHGTMVTRYQYSQALDEAESPEDVDISKFTYPGPAPRSRETAILMLADGTEARSRANTPTSDDEIRDAINNVIEYAKDSGQLDNTDLTLRDLTIIRESFLETLKRSYHPRIKYPELKREPTQPVVIAEENSAN